MNLQISYATAQDAQAVAQIHVDAWRAAYAGILPPAYLASLSVPQREAMWRQVIDDRATDLLLARRDGVVQGWLYFGPSRDAGVPTTEGEVMALYVAPASWSSGIGRQLWSRAKDAMVQQGYMTCSLWVFAQNAPAIKFCRALGFAQSPVPMRDFDLGGQACQEVRYACPIDR